MLVWDIWQTNLVGQFVQISQHSGFCGLQKHLYQTDVKGIAPFPNTLLPRQTSGNSNGKRLLIKSIKLIQTKWFGCIIFKYYNDVHVASFLHHRHPIEQRPPPNWYPITWCVTLQHAEEGAGEGPLKPRGIQTRFDFNAETLHPVNGTRARSISRTHCLLLEGSTWKHLNCSGNRSDSSHFA